MISGGLKLWYGPFHNLYCYLHPFKVQVPKTHFVCVYIPEISTTPLTTKIEIFIDTWMRNDLASKSYPGVSFLESLIIPTVLILTPQKKNPKQSSIHR